RLSGVLVPDLGVIRLLPPQPAVVVERRAAEGEAVRTGDVLFVLSPEVTSSRGDTQAAVQASLDARERSLLLSAEHERTRLELQRDDLQRRVADMRGALATMAAQAAVHRQQLESAEQELARWQALRGQQFASEAHVQVRNEAVLTARARLQELELRRLEHVR